MGEKMKKVLISPTLGLDLEGITSVIYNHLLVFEISGRRYDLRYFL